MEWPVSDRFFIVSLENFPASPEALAKALKEKSIMGTPIRSVGPVESLSLALADFRSMLGTRAASGAGTPSKCESPA